MAGSVKKGQLRNLAFDAAWLCRPLHLGAGAIGPAHEPQSVLIPIFVSCNVSRSVYHCCDPYDRQSDQHLFKVRQNRECSLRFFSASENSHALL